MIADISGISNEDRKEILDIIKKSDGGFLNMHGYHSLVWEKYFKGREWNEYEEQNTIFKKYGKFPIKFPVKKDFSPSNNENALSLLKVTELKNLCSENSIEISSKSRKSDLVDLLKSVKGITDIPLVTKKIEEVDEGFNYLLYSLFMRAINFKGTNLFNKKREDRLGFKKYKIFYVIEEDRELVDIALKIKANAIHPLFPADMSHRQAVIDFIQHS